jgi:hypothetical protein
LAHPAAPLTAGLRPWISDGSKSFESDFCVKCYTSQTGNAKKSLTMDFTASHFNESRFSITSKARLLKPKEPGSHQLEKQHFWTHKTKTTLIEPIGARTLKVTLKVNNTYNFSSTKDVVSSEDSE